MRITVGQLRRIIREEVSIARKRKRRMNEGPDLPPPPMQPPAEYSSQYANSSQTASQCRGILKMMAASIGLKSMDEMRDLIVSGSGKLFGKVADYFPNARVREYIPIVRAMLDVVDGEDPRNLPPEIQQHFQEAGLL